MKRRILLCLLVLCTVLMLAPMATLAVSAAESDVVATVTYQGTILSEAQTLSEAFAAAGKREGSTVKLENDVVITAGFAFNGTYTFDLNGHTITAYTPLIQTRGTVTIIDSSSAKTGAIRGLGSSLPTTIISIIGVCVFRVIWIYYIFPLPKFHSLEGIYISYPISWLALLIAYAITFAILFKLKKRNTERESIAN